jgi:hypothetical protein
MALSTSTSLHGATYQKTVIFINTAHYRYSTIKEAKQNNTKITNIIITTTVILLVFMAIGMYSGILFVVG